jgi:hypothetical protein
MTAEQQEYLEHLEESIELTQYHLDQMIRERELLLKEINQLS